MLVRTSDPDGQPFEDGSGASFFGQRFEVLGWVKKTKKAETASEETSEESSEESSDEDEFVVADTSDIPFFNMGTEEPKKTKKEEVPWLS